MDVSRSQLVLLQRWRIFTETTKWAAIWSSRQASSSWWDRLPLASTPRPGWADIFCFGTPKIAIIQNFVNNRWTTTTRTQAQQQKNAPRLLLQVFMMMRMIMMMRRMNLIRRMLRMMKRLATPKRWFPLQSLIRQWPSWERRASKWVQNNPVVWKNKSNLTKSQQRGIIRTFFFRWRCFKTPRILSNQV